MLTVSFPTRERGLKCNGVSAIIGHIVVVPHAGTWIEIEKLFEGKHHIGVVPQAGTWIEIY